MCMQDLEQQVLGQVQQHVLHPLAAAIEDQLRARAAATCIPGTLHTQLARFHFSVLCSMRAQRQKADAAAGPTYLR